MENEEKNLSEEGLGDILEEQGKALTETLKEQQNPQDPNTVEKELEERAKEKELKKKLNDEIEGNTRGSTSFSDPLRFQKQLTEFNKMFPEPTIQERSEMLTDFKAGTMAGSIISEYYPVPKGTAAFTGIAAATLGKFKRHIFKAIDDTGITQPFKIMRGDLLGNTTLGLPQNVIRQNQLMFGWESASNAASIAQAKPGGFFQIQPRLVRRNRNQVQRKGFMFQKPITLDITNGFKTSRRHRNFEEFIQDLLEADRIPAKNIDIAGFRSSAVRQAKYGTELDLYQDYLQGYFNTYDTLDGAMALTINNKSVKLGQSAMGAKSIENLTEINKLFRAYKLNPKSFDSGAFAPGSKTDVKLLKEFADANDLDDFLIKNTKLQRHHLNIIDDSFALVKGLTGNDLTRMRKAMNEIGLIAGNDPENLARVPQQLHQNFVHTQIWGAYGPEWTGRSAKAKRIRNQISSLPFEERLPYLNQLREAEQLTRSIINNAVDEYIDTQIAGFKISLADADDFSDFMDKLVKRDLSQTKLIDINQPTTIRSTDKSGRRTRRQADLEDIGAERMQDDLQ